MNKTKRIAAVLLIGVFMGATYSVFLSPASGVAKRGWACNHEPGKALGVENNPHC